MSLGPRRGPETFVHRDAQHVVLPWGGTVRERVRLGPQYSRLQTQASRIPGHATIESNSSRSAPAELGRNVGQDVVENVGVVVDTELVRHGE
jgi:hypothetical protein